LTFESAEASYPFRADAEEVLVRRKFRILEQFLLSKTLIAELQKVLVVEVFNLKRSVQNGSNLAAFFMIL
jgi:hypothetical protein